jgi:uncharacterized glyoxalase superfamily protein PhnB
MTIKNGVPEGLHALTPHLVCKGASGAIEFYAKAFGAELKSRLDGPGGTVMHADVRVGDSTFWLADECLDYGLRSPETVGGSPTAICLHVPDCDKVYERALKAGAKSVQKPEDTVWGSRFARVVDPYGHAWSISTQTREVTPAEIQAAMQKMAPPAKN